MEHVLRRHLSSVVLAAVLFVQVVGLAMQIKRPTQAGKVPLIRVWAITLVTPVESGVVHVEDFFHNVWRDYFYLRDVRSENDQLRDENAQLRLEQVRMAEDVGQAQRLQSLLAFKKQFISQTIAAQVVGSSGSEQSRIIYIDKGANDGIKPDMAVIAPSGVVGKVVNVFSTSAQVLEINDSSSGVGAILEKSRLQGILRGNANGEAVLRYIMADEKVEVGEQVLTSGGDRIFPKGLPIGEVTKVTPGTDVFMDIRVKPSARLDKLEEVLVITNLAEQAPEAPAEGPVRAIDILAERLPTVPPKPPDTKTAGTPGSESAPAGTAGAAPGTGPGTGATKPKGAAGAATGAAGVNASAAKAASAGAAKAATAGTTKATTANGANPSNRTGRLPDSAPKKNATPAPKTATSTGAQAAAETAPRTKPVPPAEPAGETTTPKEINP